MNDSYSGAGTDEACFQEPGQAQTHQDVEDVAADGVADLRNYWLYNTEMKV